MYYAIQHFIHSTVIRISVLPLRLWRRKRCAFVEHASLHIYIYIYGGRSRLRDRSGGSQEKIELPMMSEGDLRVSWEDAVRLRGVGLHTSEVLGLGLKGLMD